MSHGAGLVVINQNKQGRKSITSISLLPKTQKWCILEHRLAKQKTVHQTMTKQQKPIKLVPRTDGDDLAALTTEQLQRIGELALER
jgi:hypothetical protein